MFKENAVVKYHTIVKDHDIVNNHDSVKCILDDIERYIYMNIQ